MTAPLDRIAGYLEALQGLAPLIAAKRHDLDRERRLPDDLFMALADAGLFRLWLPRPLGGPELSPLEFMAVVEAAAALDGTVGWLVGNGGGMSRAGGYLPESVVRDWFADPRCFIVSSTGAVGTARAVEGGYRVSGRWPFGSGSPHATQFQGFATLGGGTGADQPRLCCYFSRAQVTLHDTWHVSGLRGTGSADFSVEEEFVPAEQAHPFLGSPPTVAGLVYRMPPASVYAWTVTVVPLGIARGALEAFAHLAGAKSRAGSNSLLRDRELVQAMLGRAEATHRAARAFLVEAMVELMAATDAGGERLLQARALLRTAAAYAAESARRIVEWLAADAGATAIFESCPLERAVRDIQAAIKHIAMSPASYVVTGRMALGLDPGTTRF